MNLAPARRLGEKILVELAPLCERSEIAGSIRRQRVVVGDLDLVILPKAGKLRAIQNRCREKCAPIREGEQNCIYGLPLPDGSRFQLDIFFARPAKADLLDTVPGNWGTLLLCRTGSKEHNIFLVAQAKRLGLRWNPYRGVMDDAASRVLASETEEAIFTALDLAFIPPENRER